MDNLAFLSFQVKMNDLLSRIAYGQNILIHAPGGFGKTYTLKKIAIYIRDVLGEEFALTATTGIAALGLFDESQNLGASTIHSWGGLGMIGFHTNLEQLRWKIYHTPPKREAWVKTKILIIDEVSMLGQFVFEALDFIARSLRGSDALFGGMQLILSGDFLQLPPVKDRWAFCSKKWQLLNFVPVVLENPRRYDDVEWAEMLLRIRSGKQSEEDIEFLIEKNKRYLEVTEEERKIQIIDRVKPTIIYSLNKDVAQENQRELNKLPGAPKVYYAKDSLEKTKNDQVTIAEFLPLLNDAIPDQITLKVGAQVMLKKNLQLAEYYANGSRGVITQLFDDSVGVRFLNGKKKFIKVQSFSAENKDGKATRLQIPFVLAWSITCHKSQGCTLDYAVCDLGPSIFLDGQAYVALSRVRNRDGLFLSSFWPNSMRVNQEALAFSESLRKNALYIDNEEENKYPNEFTYIPDLFDEKQEEELTKEFPESRDFFLEDPSLPSTIRKLVDLSSQWIPKIKCTMYFTLGNDLDVEFVKDSMIFPVKVARRSMYLYSDLSWKRKITGNAITYSVTKS